MPRMSRGKMGHAVPCPTQAGDVLFFIYPTIHGSGVEEIGRRESGQQPIIKKRSRNMATENSVPSFARDIRPLFREDDRESMEFAFDLWNYQDVCEHAEDILERLTDGSMP